MELAQNMKTSGIEDPDTNSCNYIYLIFDKVSQNMHWRKESL
jgi:hypothetical protein